MEVRATIQNIGAFIKGIFVKKSDVGGKAELKFGNIKMMALTLLVLFFLIVLVMPNESDVGFSSKMDNSAKDKKSSPADSTHAQSDKASNLWGKPKMPSGSGGSAANYNQSMVIGPSNGNAKTQLRAGIRVPIRVLDKFVVSETAVPILAESISDVRTDSGLYLPAGTKFYGEASHQRDTDRALVRFSQISLPSGEIRQVRAMALGKDGQSGLIGDLKTDAVKNTAGQMVTSFISGFAAGSMQTDMLGGSKGGVQNGLLNAVATTAKERAQGYGEKLKRERQWVEVAQFAEGDVTFSEALNLGPGGDR